MMSVDYLSGRWIVILRRLSGDGDVGGCMLELESRLTWMSRSSEQVTFGSLVAN